MSRFQRKSISLYLRMGRSDLLVILTIVGSFAIALVLMPIQHEFSYIDDWDYAHAAQRIAQDQGFVPTEASQATLVFHAYWGALFVGMFGSSFTVLTAATMILSLVAALTFYGLLRQIGFSANLSGLGVAILASNYIFITRSYSFNTDITFLAMLLLSCMCYYQGISSTTLNNESSLHILSNSQHPKRLQSLIFLGLGSVFATLAFLTRQFGIILPLAIIFWLLYARHFTGLRLLMAITLPVTVAVAYFCWRAGYPTIGGSAVREGLLELLHNPMTWVQRAGRVVFILLPIIGLTVPLFTRLRTGRWVAFLALLAALAVFWGQHILRSKTTTQSLADEPFWVIQPFRLDYTPVWAIGAALAVWLIAGNVERGWQRGCSLLRRECAPKSQDFLIILAVLLLVGTAIFNVHLSQTYILPLLPFVIAGSLGPLVGWTVRQLIPTIGLLVIVVFFSVALHLDDFDFNAVRWQAGRDLVEQGIPYEKIDNGFAWDCNYLFDAATRRLGLHDVKDARSINLPQAAIDPEYVVSIKSLAGYKITRTYSYYSRLMGLRTYPLYILRRE